MDKTEAKRMRELTKAILCKQNKTYEQWLYEKHFEFILQASGFLLDTLTKNN